VQNEPNFDYLNSRKAVILFALAIH